MATVASAALWLGAEAAHADDPPDCRSVPYVSASCFSFGDRARCPPLPPDPCYWVRGRLSFVNGTPAVRLSPKGTRRMLGVLGGDGDPGSPRLLPAEVDARSTPPQPGSRLDLEGRFEVCPLTPDKPGWMRPVCLAGASDLAPAPRR